MQLGKLFFVLSAVLVLTACTTVKQEQEQKSQIIPPAIEKPVLPSLQRELLDPCIPLPRLAEKEYTQDESLQIIKAWSYLYYQCSKKQAALADLLDKAYSK